MSGQQLDVKRIAGHSDPDILRAAVRYQLRPNTPGAGQIRRLSGQPAVRGRRPADRVVPAGRHLMPGYLAVDTRHTLGSR
jgi:hypothetical protein